MISRSVADDMLLNPKCCSFSWLHTCTHCHRSLFQKKKCYPIVHFTTGNVEVKMLSGPGWHLWVKMHIQMQADFHSRDVRHNDTYKQPPKHWFWTSSFFFFLLLSFPLDTAYQLVSLRRITSLWGNSATWKEKRRVWISIIHLEKKFWNFTRIICTVKTSCTEESDTLWPSLWDLCHLAVKSVPCCLVLSTGWIYLITSCLCNRQILVTLSVEVLIFDYYLFGFFF